MLPTARPIAVALFAMLLAVSCGGLAAKGDAEAAVATFHEMLDAERYADMYEAADDAFKNVASRGQFVQALEAVHRKMGAVRSAAQTQFFSEDRVGTDAGSYIRFVYDTEFAEGRATETFSWRVSDKKIRLYYYNINSPILVTR